MNQTWQRCDRCRAIAAGVVQQNDLAACFGIRIHRAIDRPLDDLIRCDWKLPVVRIDTHADHDVAEILRDERRLDLLRLVSLRVAEVRRTK